MRLAELEGRRVAVWGAGREGRAAWRWLRAHAPQLPVAVICPASEVAAARGFAGDGAEIIGGEATLDTLRRFEVIVKSPGISPYREPAVAAQAAGVRFTSGTALWFAANPHARTIAITGTKGKSSTTAMVAHLLRAAGRRVVLAGNIGLPLLEVPPDTSADWWVLELSSFQCRDLGGVPEIGAVLNLFPEHLDWHGGVERYYRDKLRLLGVPGARPRVSVMNAAQQWPEGAVPEAGVRWFGDPDGFHVAGGAIARGDRPVLELAVIPLPGLHNALNLCAALALVEAAGEDAVALAPSIRGFRALPHRLQALGVRDGLLWVNDSIATTPHATLAALAHYRGRPLALLVGGHDRGVPWDGFAAAVADDPPRAIIAIGAAGPRILDALAALDPAHTALHRAVDLADAVARARAALAGTGDGVVLLSPGAPSFGEFRDYDDRGRRFAALAGFDPDDISHIEGLGT
jgi:UDP-N-acetylmuramoylalanine--D-glutamate ligase